MCITGCTIKASRTKEISADKKTITLKLLEDEVAISTDYIIKGVYDSIGQLAKDELTFKTPKSFGVYVDSVSKADLSESGKVKTTVKIGNAKNGELPVFIMVAVYGEYYETFGVGAVKIENMGAEGYEGTITVDIGSRSKDDIKGIQLFLWDSMESMTSYQMAESIGF